MADSDGGGSSNLTASGDATAQLAQTLPGHDPSPAIAAAEHGLLDFLNKQIQQILNQLPLQRLPEHPPAGPSDPQPPADPAAAAPPFDPFQLISSIVGGLGALGPGLFSGVDPTQILGNISAAMDGTAIPLQQARGSLANDWQGGSGAAADAKTRAAVGNGAEVATQADALRENLAAAASDVAHARKRMIDIIDEFQAKMAAVDVTTPSGRAVAIAAANEAHKESTAVVKELQSKLRAHAERASAIGAPVGVTSVPQARSNPNSRPKTKSKNRPNVAKIPVSKVQYNRRDYAEGKAAYNIHIAKTLDVMGITDPQARRNWTRGLLTAASRESSFNPGAVNKWDSNAHGATKSDGAPANSSRGGLQTIPTTFAAYHQAGTSNNIYDPVANAAAAMNYVMARYDVDRDGSNLDKVSQFDPNDSPQGY